MSLFLCEPMNTMQFYVVRHLNLGDLRECFGSTVAVNGTQFGDEGKGKIVHTLGYVIDAYDFVRWAGGPNAGHTVCFDGETHKHHNMPSGATYRHALNIIGNGCVVDPIKLCGEIDTLEEAGYKLIPAPGGWGNLLIDRTAHIIMPWAIELDEFRERARGNDKIGTTGRGIGPTYMYKAGRSEAIRFYDILDQERFERRIKEVAKSERNQFETRFKETLPNIYNDPDYTGYIEERLGEYQQKFEQMGEELYPFCERLIPYIGDGGETIREHLERGMSIIFEGAQGTSIDIDHGTYPKVTSSNPTIGGVHTGTGYGGEIDTKIGVMKAYVSRVGSGAFPTKLSGDFAKRIRKVGGEYGTTTGRARDVGWLDLVQVNDSCKINGTNQLAWTKLDVLTQTVTEVKVCYAYEIDGSETQKFPHDDLILQRAVPKYETFKNLPRMTPGELIKDAEEGRFEKPIRKIKDYIEEYTSVPITIISVSPDRADTVIMV